MVCTRNGSITDRYDTVETARLGKETVCGKNGTETVRSRNGTVEPTRLVERLATSPKTKNHGCHEAPVVSLFYERNSDEIKRKEKINE